MIDRDSARERSTENGILICFYNDDTDESGSYIVDD